MKRRYKKSKIGTIFVLLVTIFTLLISIGCSYGWWKDNIYIKGEITTGYWGDCLCIRKILNGPYTDPYTGEQLEYELNEIYEYSDGIRLIHQTDRLSPIYLGMYKGFPTRFILTIEITNDCYNDFTNIIITDQIGNQVAPREVGPVPRKVIDMYPVDDCDVSWTRGLEDYYQFGHDDIIWTIGELKAGERAYIRLLVETLPNRAHGQGIQGFFEPTSGDQPIEINQGATVTYTYNFETYSATTDEIKLELDLDDPEDNERIALIITTLPVVDGGIEDGKEVLYLTDWACAEVVED